MCVCVCVMAYDTLKYEQYKDIWTVATGWQLPIVGSLIMIQQWQIVPCLCRYGHEYIHMYVCVHVGMSIIIACIAHRAVWGIIAPSTI